MGKRRLPSADQQAAGFEKVRRAHQDETAEDYVELIADLIDETGEARLVDLASRFSVTHATANKVVSRLHRDGLVDTKPYRPIELTAEGHEMARRARHRHRIVHNFLLALGVSAETAHNDAEGIEHHVSRETLAAFERFIRDREPE